MYTLRSLPMQGCGPPVGIQYPALYTEINFASSQSKKKTRTASDPLNEHVVMLFHIHWVPRSNQSSRDRNFGTYAGRHVQMFTMLSREPTGIGRSSGKNVIVQLHEPDASNEHSYHKQGVHGSPSMLSKPLPIWRRNLGTFEAR